MKILNIKITLGKIPSEIRQSRETIRTQDLFFSQTLRILHNLLQILIQNRSFRNEHAKALLIRGQPTLVSSQNICLTNFIIKGTKFLALPMVIHITQSSFSCAEFL